MVDDGWCFYYPNPQLYCFAVSSPTEICVHRKSSLFMGAPYSWQINKELLDLLNLLDLLAPGAGQRSRYKSGRAAEFGAKEMLAKLEAKGIRSLEDQPFKSSCTWGWDGFSICGTTPNETRGMGGGSTYLMVILIFTCHRHSGIECCYVVLEAAL